MKENEERFSKSFTIDPKYVGLVIGNGGKTIKRIVANSNNSKIDVNDEGEVKIDAATKQDLERAEQEVMRIVNSVETRVALDLNKVHDATIAEVLSFGLVLNTMDGAEGLLHISKISNDYIGDLNEKFSVGDTIKVMVESIEKNGKYRFFVPEDLR